MVGILRVHKAQPRVCLSHDLAVTHVGSRVVSVSPAVMCGGLQSTETDCRHQGTLAKFPAALRVEGDTSSTAGRRRHGFDCGLFNFSATLRSLHSVCGLEWSNVSGKKLGIQLGSGYPSHGEATAEVLRTSSTSSAGVPSHGGSEPRRRLVSSRSISS